MSLNRLAAICAVATIFHATSSTAADRPAPKPNIVFILADDLGSHDVGWRGSEIKTPHLDQLASGGARLNQFYVQPVCSPTRAALMTGRYPFRYGLQTGVVRPWAQYGLPLEERLLPQALKEAGYETAIVGKWHLGHFQPEYLPTRRGFDHQYGHYNGALDYFTHVRDGGFDWHKNDKVNRDEGYSTELVGKEASRLIEQRDSSKPLFLYVPFNGVHGPYQAPPEYTQRYPQFSGKRRTYAGMVTALDDAVGKIVAALKSEHMLDNTLVIFSSDNGGPAPGTITSNGELRAGKGTLYEGGVRVCAFASWPGHLKSADVEAPIHMTDWYPTLLGLAGAKTEQPLPIDGQDVWPALTEGKPGRESLVINTAPTGGAIRVGDWKLVVNGSAVDDEADEAPAAKKGKRNRDGKDSVELFNLAKDVSEKTNLAATEPEKVSDLKKRLAKYADEAVPPKLAPKQPGFESPKVWGETN
jgi:arylsulfatase A-like enzyme